MEFPRFIIAALRGGSGKTILSIGVIAALNKLGKSVAPFKKGPDYIDAGWLTLAAGRPCYNLDSFLLSPSDNLHSFLSHSVNCDISVIEGNRGLYDGIDLQGSTSTAELAKLIKSPVILCVDCTKVTRTMAAVVAGCSQFDSEVMINGVILNRVANPRHEKKIRDSIDHYCGIPIIGAIPKIGERHFPERHLGLVPTPEHDWANHSIEAITEVAEKYIDLEALIDVAKNAPDLKSDIKSQKTEDRDLASEVGLRRAQPSRSRNAEIEDQQQVSRIQRPIASIRQPVSSVAKPIVRVGIIRDSAFQFYYPENIDALVEHGAEILYISPLKDRDLPELDGLYIGGGFPETHAGQLAANKNFSSKLKSLAEEGFPIYAECGGLMYLGENLILEDKSYPMVGILPLTFDFFKRPQGHGYTIVKVEKENPYFDVGSKIRGHEFHYSRVSERDRQKGDLVFRMERGAGIEKDQDGIVYKNVLATYTHIHALGTPGWAAALIRNAINYQKG